MSRKEKFLFFLAWTSYGTWGTLKFLVYWNISTMVSIDECVAFWLSLILSSMDGNNFPLCFFYSIRISVFEVNEFHELNISGNHPAQPTTAHDFQLLLSTIQHYALKLCKTMLLSFSSYFLHFFMCVSSWRKFDMTIESNGCFRLIAVIRMNEDMRVRFKCFSDLVLWGEVKEHWRKEVKQCQRHFVEKDVISVEIRVKELSWGIF